MTPTLLIDLDDTLLSNDMDVFLPAYLQALGAHLADVADGKRMVQKLLAATRLMIANRLPDCTLKEVFDSAFYPSLGLQEKDLRERIDQFYTQVFPTLRGLTAPRPEAKKLVEKALQRGYNLVVATNPLFPRTAVLQRLAWAGLPVEEYPFQLVCSYESLHFAKPNPAFLAECLGLLGWTEGPVVMIGNDLENDIQTARRLGLPAFWFKSDGVESHDESPSTSSPAGPTAVGRLEDFFTWLDETDEEALQPDTLLPGANLASLLATPAVLDTFSRGLTDETWTRRPDAGEWSLTEIACHLRDVDEEVNLPRLRKVLQENNPFLPGMVTDPWAEERAYICQNGPQALSRFIIARMKILDFLESLSPEDWQRTARHAIFGPTHLYELVAIQASHDRLHIQQAIQTLFE